MQTIKTIDSKFYHELGNKIRQIREHRDMTLLELSKATGYSRTLIDHWELGLNKIKPKQLENICKALDITNNLSVSVKLGFLLDD